MTAYPFPLIEIKGPPRQRGRQYGAQCKTLIERSIDFYRWAFRRESALDWDVSAEKSREFIAPIKAYDAEILEEMEGVAEGADRELTDILALNVRSELVFLLAAQGKKAKPACTSLAAAPPATTAKETLIAQNWDWWARTREQCILLRITQPGRPSILQVVEAGLVAKTGMNSTGIGLCTNALVSDKWRVGVPFHVILRGILNATSMGEAIGAVTRAQRASAGNYMIAHRDGMAINIEAAPEDQNLIYPQEGLLTHANHFQIDHPNIQDQKLSLWPDSIVRDYRAAALLKDRRGAVDTLFIMNLLKDHFDHPLSICSHPPADIPYEEAEQTNAAVIMNLSRGRFWVAKGPPCENTFVEVPFA